MAHINGSAEDAAQHRRGFGRLFAAGAERAEFEGRFGRFLGRLGQRHGHRNQVGWRRPVVAHRRRAGSAGARPAVENRIADQTRMARQRMERAQRRNSGRMMAAHSCSGSKDIQPMTFTAVATLRK